MRRKTYSSSAPCTSSSGREGEDTPPDGTELNSVRCVCRCGWKHTYSSVLNTLEFTGMLITVQTGKQIENDLFTLTEETDTTLKLTYQMLVHTFFFTTLRASVTCMHLLTSYSVHAVE